MLKVWGRNTSSNVQKVMWAIGELKLAYERIDIGGPFGKNKEPAYLAMNPNGLVPKPADLKTRALASKWMDWQLAVMGPAITPVFWGLVRTPPESRDMKAIDAAKVKTTETVQMLDAQLARTPFAAGDAFSYGDIPIGIMARRYRDLVPERPAFPNFERWYGTIAARPAFKEHVTGVPLV